MATTTNTSKIFTEALAYLKAYCDALDVSMWSETGSWTTQEVWDALGYLSFEKREGYDEIDQFDPILAELAKELDQYVDREILQISC
jgi:hypothetical protein